VSIASAMGACGPTVPEAETVTSGRTGETKVTVTRTDPNEESASGPPSATTDNLGPSQSTPAKPIDPPAKPLLSSSIALGSAMSGEGPLPLPTVIAAAKGNLFAFGSTRSGWIVRTLPQKGKSPTWSKPAVVASAFDDDVAFAIGDGEHAWFGVSSPAGGVRIARVDASTKVTTINKPPSKLGGVVAFVPLKSHVAVIGRDGDAITFARLDRVSGFLDPAAKIIARGSTSSRSPRATNEDDRVLLAWDADSVSGALEAPGTTPAEKAAPKPGIFVRRFHGSGEPASPARRLTRPSFEAHVLDVVVELGACAVLARTPDGFEMFRFVRKGDDLNPYGGGLHLAAPGGDVALGADVIGTIGITPSKLLRIGPGIKIVASPLGFSPPPGVAFDEARIAMDGYGAHLLLTTRTSVGPQPTIARIDGEHMGPVLPTPWFGPPPQKLLYAALDGDEALALVVDGSAIHAIRLGADGSLRSKTPLPVDAKQTAVLDWPNAPVPRAARAGNEWIIALRDGRALIATGPRAGALVPLAPPGQSGGVIAVVPTGNKSATLRVVYIPPVDHAARLFTTSIDPKQASIATWAPIAGSEHNYGALGGARFTALPRISGGIVVLTNSGPKVSSVAQLYGLVGIDELGNTRDVSIEAPFPIQDISLVPTLGGAALVATLTGKGVAARWLDGPMKGWRESFAFTPFRARGDGPVIREKGVPWLLSEGALPIDLSGDTASFVGERCPFVMPTGPRSVLLACEESSGDSPLAGRATVRVLRL